ncbi:uncharacterized protein LOC111087649, partial [Limulus polyphemus]|uniref:Uncharacterized protein LOC111087649 n=1 Tax=Limulus polyphemus TaxID=6850 RepID=A0ABM1T4A0_LIMPO
MPFSIKRFAMHCSTSMPSGSRSDENKKNAQPNDQRRPASSSARKIIKKSASQEEHKGKQTSSQGLQSSHSVDSAELKRLRKQQNLIHRDEESNETDRNGIVSVRPAGEESRRIPRDALRRTQRDFQDKSSCDQSSALPGRWRAPGRIRSTAEARGMYYDEQSEDNGEDRKLFMRRDGTPRYFDACLLELKQSKDACLLELKQSKDACLLELKQFKDACMLELKQTKDACLLELRQFKDACQLELKQSKDACLLELKQSKDACLLELKQSKDA